MAEAEAEDSLYHYDYKEKWEAALLDSEAPTPAADTGKPTKPTSSQSVDRDWIDIKTNFYFSKTK